MSMKESSTRSEIVRKRWKRTCCRIIADVFSNEIARLDKIKVAHETGSIDENGNNEAVNAVYSEYYYVYRFSFLDSMSYSYLLCRKGINLYEAGEYHDAINCLSKLTIDDSRLIAKSERGKRIHFMEHMCKISVSAARCCFQLFLLTKSHYHLENSYIHFQNAIDNFRIDMGTYYTLPPLLAEYGRMLEHYGAFPAAMETYTNLLRVFPNYKGYFTILYRSSIIGVQLSELLNEAAAKNELLNQSTDILTFLLEALPDDINEMHIVLLYAKALELSSDIGARFRASGIYNSLYDICYAAKPISIANAKQHNNNKAWLAKPDTWLLLGDRIASEHEPLLARFCYENYVERIKPSVGLNRSLGSIIGVDNLLNIAKNYASYQNYEDATKYGEMAFEVDHFHKETRRCLALWSKIYNAMLTREEYAIKLLATSWKERCWTNGYRKKVKNVLLKDLESQYSNARMNDNLRDQLAYYSTDRWRARFLFENECANRVQVFWKRRKRLWAWQDVQRAKYLSLASTAYAQFRKQPLSKAVRDEVIKITSHRLCPKKHAINKVKEIIDLQNKAIRVIAKTIRCRTIRRGFERCIKLKRDIRDEAIREAVTSIQRFVRGRQARRRYFELFEMHLRKLRAICTVQRFIRWRNAQFQHAVTRVINRRRRETALAHNIMEMLLIPLIVRYLHRFKKRQARKLYELRLEAEREKKRAQYRTIDGLCKRLQRVFRRRFVEQNHHDFSVNRLMTRRLSYYVSMPLEMTNPGRSVSINAALVSPMLLRSQSFTLNNNNTSPNGVLNSNNVLIQLSATGVSPTPTASTFGSITLVASTHLLDLLKNIVFLVDEDENNIANRNEIRRHYYISEKNLYRSPGAKQNTDLFKFVLQQHTIYCNPLVFSHVDILIFASVLRHPQCKVQHLIFHNIDGRHPNYAFDLLNGIRKCRSLRTIALCGGCWNDSFISNLFSSIQEENNRIIHIYLESISINEINRQYSFGLFQHTANLMQDYFNYSLPGLTTLSLHNSQLRDTDLQLFQRGLQVNTSLTTIILSNNLIEDEGCILLLTSLAFNLEKKAIQKIDLSFNLLRLNGKLRAILDHFEELCSYKDNNNGKYTKAVEHIVQVKNKQDKSKPLAIASIVSENVVNKSTGYGNGQHISLLNIEYLLKRPPLHIHLDNNYIFRAYELPPSYTTRNFIHLHGVKDLDTHYYVNQYATKWSHKQHQLELQQMQAQQQQFQRQLHKQAESIKVKKDSKRDDESSMCSSSIDSDNTSAATSQQSQVYNAAAADFISNFNQQQREMQTNQHFASNCSHSSDDNDSFASCDSSQVTGVAMIQNREQQHQQSRQMPLYEVMIKMRQHAQDLQQQELRFKLFMQKQKQQQTNDLYNQHHMTYDNIHKFESQGLEDAYIKDKSKPDDHPNNSTLRVLSDKGNAANNNISRSLHPIDGNGAGNDRQLYNKNRNGKRSGNRLFSKTSVI